MPKSPHVAVLCCLAHLLTCAPAAVAREADADPAGRTTPVIFDTDLGTGIDDAFALALILASPELDLRAVTTVSGPAEDRAWMACRFLTHCDRRDVPVAWGRDPQPEAEIDWQIQYRRHPAVVWDRTAKPVEKSAVELMREVLEASEQPVTIIAAGPLTNVARLLREHPECNRRIKYIALALGEEGRDVTADREASKEVFESGIPSGYFPDAKAEDLRLEAAAREDLFAACTPLTFQAQALYELWDQETPTLHSVAAVAAALGGPRPDDSGRFVKWYVERVVGFGDKVLPMEPKNESELVDRGNLPLRVHVFEDFETDIEKRWWMTGKAETEDVPPGGGKRSCRGVLTQDYDDLMGDVKATYRAVVFNPVPGPPTGKNTRLSFKYKIRGTDTIRVQLYSLSNGYHRYLSIKGLPQGEWQDAAVDMTQMRRPDGTGGPLAEDERIDDIQFYVDPRAELLIDDIVLYEPAPAEETHPFPDQFVFTGWFDTGEEGKEWPGDFEIVGHEPPLTWDAAKSVVNADTGQPWLRIHLRGPRPLPAAGTDLRFRYRLDGPAEGVGVALVDGTSGRRIEGQFVSDLVSGEWAEGTAHFPAGALVAADELHFKLPEGATLLVDDVLLYGRAAEGGPR